MAESDIILSYIERKGWQTTQAGNGWHVTPAETGPSFYLSFTPSWVCLHAPLDAYLPENHEARRVDLYRRLLRLNESLFMAKFALDPAGRPLLLVEIPLGGNLRLVEHALEALTRHLAPCAAGLDTLEIPPAGDRAARERYFEEPPGIPHEVIAYYIRSVETQGWGARSKPQGVTWSLGYKGQRMFNAYLTITRSWTYFHIPALLRLPGPADGMNAAAQQTFLAYLLGINNAWYMAKLGIDEQDQVLLMLELPTQELEFDTFRMIIRLLGTYLDFYAREIQIMANLPADQKLMQMLASR